MRRRKRGEWQSPADDEILELLADSGLVLSPAIIAFNLDRSRTGITGRITELRKRGLIERVDRGKYEITEDGLQYLKGELDAGQLEKDN